MALRAERITRIALLAAAAAVLSYLESLLPLHVFLPLPGFKLGFANVAVLIAVGFFSPGEAVLVVLVRTLAASLLFGGMSAFFYSICGGLLSLAVMLPLREQLGRRFSLPGISAAGAAAHNTGQIIAAAVMMRSGAVFGYLPVLLVASLPVGTLMGVLAAMVCARLDESK